MKRNKFNAVKTVVDGITFDSKKEAKRYGELKMLGVEMLEVHPRFPLVVNDMLIATYVGDFMYIDGNGITVVEDVKGGNATKTASYRMKRKLMKAIRNIEVREI